MQVLHLDFNDKLYNFSKDGTVAHAQLLAIVAQPMQRSIYLTGSVISIMGVLVGALRTHLP